MMRYSVQFQYRPKDSLRPLDYGQSIPINNDAGDLFLLPNIGDHVEHPSDDDINGVVENRLFNYIKFGEDAACLINIVITDTETDGGTLIKE